MHPLLRTTTLFWKYWQRAIVTYFCLLAGAGLALVIPSLTGQAINLALGTKQTHTLVLTALAIGAAGILGSTLIALFGGNPMAIIVIAGVSMLIAGTAVFFVKEKTASIK